MDEVTMTWTCPDCGRQDEVSLDVMRVEVKVARPGAEDYGDDGFKWAEGYNYQVDGFACGPCADADSDRREEGRCLTTS